jgi:hypothetical protein
VVPHRERRQCSGSASSLVPDIVCFTRAERDPTIKRVYGGTRWVPDALFAKRSREVPSSTARPKPSVKIETRPAGPSWTAPASTAGIHDGGCVTRDEEHRSVENPFSGGADGQWGHRGKTPIGWTRGSYLAEGEAESMARPWAFQEKLMITLLALLAHPDDGAFGTDGALARFAATCT